MLGSGTGKGDEEEIQRMTLEIVIVVIKSWNKISGLKLYVKWHKIRTDCLGFRSLTCNS